MPDENENLENEEIFDGNGDEDNENLEVEDTDNDEGLDIEDGSDEDTDTATDNDDTDDENDDISDEDADTDETEEESDGATAGNDKADKDNAPDDKDTKISELEQKLSKLESLSKDALEKLGIKVGDGDLADALEQAAAESEGKTLEEYRKDRKETEDLEKAKQLVRQQRFETMAAKDLADLKQSFPDLLSKDKIKDCFDDYESFVKFGSLRDSGIGAREAYLAVNGEKVRQKQSTAAQQKAANSGKEHITSIAPKKASDEMVVMPKETLNEWRDMFPDKTDKEIRELYRQTV